MKKHALLIVLAVSFACCGRTKNEIRVPGVVDGDIISIKALTGGRLEKILVSEGSPVQKDQLLAEINRDKIANSREELQIAEQEIANGEERARQKREFLKANIAYLQKQVQRFSRLKDSESVAGDQLERAKLQLLEAQTSWSDLEKSLAAFQIQREKIANRRESLRLLEKDLIFSAPSAGVVMDVYASAGETVMPGAIIAEILDLSSLYVEVFVEEQEMAALKLGQEAIIIPDGGDRRFQGRISYFGKKAEFSPKYILSEKERRELLYQVKISVLTGCDALKLGMPVTVTFKT